MTFEAYQKLQTAMVLDAGRAAPMAAGDFGQFAGVLTADERARLAAQANDPGMALTRKLHKGWRLTKLLTLLPITFRLGDPDTLTDLVAAFWHQNPPRGLYFESEALRFAESVRDQVPPEMLLHDVASFEAAMLVVGDRVDADHASSTTMHLRHDPREWLLGSPAQSAAGSFDVIVTASPDGPNVQVTRCPGNCETALPSTRLTSATPIGKGRQK
jgi:hypothetical protein